MNDSRDWTDFILDNIILMVGGMFHHKGLSRLELKRLSEHKYSVDDHSFFTEWGLAWFWNHFVKLYPMWLAPNLITLVGLAANLSACFTIALYSPDGAAEAPHWTYAFCAIALFIYQTLDATDGKQARRTNSSSPLGEMFDHGCDSLSQVFISLEVCLAMKLGERPNVMLYAVMVALFLFYASHWQTYCTGTMKFNRFDCTEAQMIVIAVCSISAIIGPDFWRGSVLGLELRVMIVIGATLLAVKSVSTYLSVVVKGGGGKNGSTIAGTSVIFPAIPIAQAILPGFVLYYKSTTGVFDEHRVLYMIFIGSLAAKVTNKLVVAHMCRSELTKWDSILYAPLILFVNQYFNNIIPEYPLLILVNIYAWLNLITWCRVVCLQICDYLKIQCFTIKTIKAGH